MAWDRVGERPLAGGLRASLDGIYKKVLAEYRTAYTARHRILQKFMPFWRRAGQSLDRVERNITGLQDSAAKIDANVDRLQAIYAEMAGPAAQLKAMNEDDREVAFGSAYGQMMGFGMKMAGVMMPLASNPDLADKVGELLDDMPAPE